MLSHFSHVRLFVTPRTVALQGPLSMGFSRQDCWSELPCLPPGDIPDPGVKSASLTLQADSLPSEPPGIRRCRYLGKLGITENMKKEESTGKMKDLRKEFMEKSNK